MRGGSVIIATPAHPPLHIVPRRLDRVALDWEVPNLVAPHTTEGFPRPLDHELGEDEVHRPALFRLADAGDRQRLHELRGRVPDLAVRDALQEQLAGLVQSR